MTGFIEKVKEAIKPSDSHHTSQPEGTHGHHNTRAANAADPRIDSDRDHRAAGAHDGSYTAGSNYTTGTTGGNRTDGPHNSDLLNKADPRVDSDRDHSRNLGANPSGTATTGTHTTGHTGTTGLHSTTGAHTGTSGLSGATGTHAGTSHSAGTGFGSTGTTGANRTGGPHNSNLLNKVDPRVDSDRDGSRNLGANPSGTATTGTYGSSGTTGLHSSTGTTGANRTDGPHNSNLLNKADPRVDSDRDHSRNLGANPSGTATTGTYGSTGTHGLSSGTTGVHSGTHTGTHTSTTGGNRTAGPHNSDLLNKADPRVDSDRDGSRNLGLNSNTSATTGNHPTGLSGSQGTHGTHGTTHLGSSTSGAPEGTHGPHSSRVANAADPRIDSDLDNRGTTGTAGGRNAIGNFGSTGAHTGTHTGTHTGAHTGTSGLTGSTGTHGTHTGAHTGTSGLTGSTGTHATGPAPNTAGPHKSDMLNKIDPRVDSDLDGSKTNPVNHTHKDPTDAAQVPPSVLQKHIGPPVVEHDDHHHDRTSRHSISHQEDHRGL